MTKYTTISITEDDSKMLDELSKVLSKSKRAIIADYVNAIKQYVAVFKTGSATLLIDDSDTRITSPEIVLKIRITGISRLESGVKPPSKEEIEADKNAPPIVKRVGKEE